jgi:hypothetical protein
VITTVPRITSADLEENIRGSIDDPRKADVSANVAELKMHLIESPSTASPGAARLLVRSIAHSLAVTDLPEQLIMLPSRYHRWSLPSTSLVDSALMKIPE